VNNSRPPGAETAAASNPFKPKNQDVTNEPNINIVYLRQRQIQHLRLLSKTNCIVACALVVQPLIGVLKKKIELRKF